MNFKSVFKIFLFLTVVLTTQQAYSSTCIVYNERDQTSGGIPYVHLNGYSLRQLVNQYNAGSSITTCKSMTAHDWLGAS